MAQVFASGTDELLELCKAFYELWHNDLKMTYQGQPPQVGRHGAAAAMPHVALCCCLVPDVLAQHCCCINTGSLCARRLPDRFPALPVRALTSSSEVALLDSTPDLIACLWGGVAILCSRGMVPTPTLAATTTSS